MLEQYGIQIISANSQLGRPNIFRYNILNTTFLLLTVFYTVIKKAKCHNTVVGEDLNSVTISLRTKVTENTKEKNNGKATNSWELRTKEQRSTKQLRILYI